MKKNYELKKDISIAVELPFGLGDQIMCFPLFASLKKAYPHSKITALSPNKNSTLILSKNKNIDHIYEYGIKKFAYKDMLNFFLKDFIKMRTFFKSSAFDYFIVVHPNVFRTVLLKLLPYKRAITNSENIHKTLECVKILEHLNVKPVFYYQMILDNDKSTLTKFNLKSKSYILLDIYGQYLNEDPRQWHYYHELIEKLKHRKDKKDKIVIAGINPAHKRRDDVLDIVNKTSLDELLCIVKNAKVVVAMDTGMYHFAYSNNTPVVGIFGPGSPRDRLPFDKKLKVKILYKDMPCSPCIINKVLIECKDQTEYKCMKDISVEEVYNAVTEF